MSNHLLFTIFRQMNSIFSRRYNLAKNEKIIIIRSLRIKIKFFFMIFFDLFFIRFLIIHIFFCFVISIFNFQFFLCFLIYTFHIIQKKSLSCTHISLCLCEDSSTKDSSNQFKLTICHIINRFNNCANWSIMWHFSAIVNSSTRINRLNFLIKLRIFFLIFVLRYVSWIQSFDFKIWI